MSVHNQTREVDEHLVRRALDLARKSVALAAPNPCVGAIIVAQDGNIAGEGFHTYDGKKHAEILALEQAGDRSHGATLYLNLEPCSHQGRTGPCADAVIVAGIRRVVCSMEDPNPLVSGKGFAKLRAAGIQVEIGGLEEEARKINEAWAKYVVQKLPFVTLKCAMTVDGKIAAGPSSTPSSRGEARSGWITGEAARAHVQRLRHQSDAILTGIGTVLADDPLLTDRTGLPRRRPLLRVVLDSNLRLPLESRLAQSAKDDLLVFTTSTDASLQDRLEKIGVGVERTATDSQNGVDFTVVLKRLTELEITSLLVEGGSHLNASLLAGRFVDKVFLYVAPRILGDSALPFAEGLARPIDLALIEIHRFGEDFAIEGYAK